MLECSGPRRRRRADEGRRRGRRSAWPGGRGGEGDAASTPYTGTPPYLSARAADRPRRSARSTRAHGGALAPRASRGGPDACTWTAASRCAASARSSPGLGRARSAQGQEVRIDRARSAHGCARCMCTTSGSRPRRPAAESPSTSPASSAARSGAAMSSCLSKCLAPAYFLDTGAAVAGCAPAARRHACARAPRHPRHSGTRRAARVRALRTGHRAARAAAAGAAARARPGRPVRAAPGRAARHAGWRIGDRPARAKARGRGGTRRAAARDRKRRPARGPAARARGGAVRCRAGSRRGAARAARRGR